MAEVGLIVGLSMESSQSMLGPCERPNSFAKIDAQFQRSTLPGDWQTTFGIPGD